MLCPVLSAQSRQRSAIGQRAAAAHILGPGLLLGSTTICRGTSIRPPRLSTPRRGKTEKLDVTSYGVVRMLDETRWEPKEVFHTMAAKYARG